MPTYEYFCATCQKVHEIFKKLAEPEPKCPECNTELTKLISKSSFQLKGSGWHNSDYNKSGPRR